MDNLTDVIVIAGPNGVGKTRTLTWLLSFFQNPAPSQENWLVIEATCENERIAWQKQSIDTRIQQDCNLLRSLLQGSIRKRAELRSSVLNFESNRSITTVQPFAFSWDMDDPYFEDIGWNFSFNSLSNRFSDTVHSIFRKVRSRREQMSLRAETLLKQKNNEGVGPSEISLRSADFPDPLIPFREAFSQLLAPKALADAEPKNQNLFYNLGALTQSIQTLSSGEREVVNVVFDFLLRGPNDCIVVFDEPELHLHPELSYKMLRTLRGAGSNNQFIFCTHSAEIISSSLDNSVIFIRPPGGPNHNQAVRVKEDDETHQALKLMGQSIGIVSLGKKIVLIEGNQSSLDKQTYGAILKAKYPELVLVPSEGKGLLQSFSQLREKVLSKSVWSVEFFMLCDRDAIPPTTNVSALTSTGEGRVSILPRYHLENYFLDSNIIAQVFKDMHEEDHWLRSPEKIEEKLQEIAKTALSYSVALIVSSHFRELCGNVDIMPKGCHDKTESELLALFQSTMNVERQRVTSSLCNNALSNQVKTTFSELDKSITDGGWKSFIPGKAILRVFCGSKYANFDFSRFKLAYLSCVANGGSDTFMEIEKIFDSFNSM